MIVLLAGCAGALVPADWDGGPFFVVSGPVEDGVRAGTEEVGAAIAWAWTEGGDTVSRVDPVPLEPRVVAYALEVLHPPEPSGAVEGFVVGLPLLYEPASRTLDVDAEALFAYVDGDVQPEVSGATVLATAPRHLILGGYDADGLTLYRSDGDDWTMLAEPGVHTEFQGIGMAPPP